MSWWEKTLFWAEIQVNAKFFCIFMFARTIGTYFFVNSCFPENIVSGHFLGWGSGNCQNIWSPNFALKWIINCVLVFLPDCYDLIIFRAISLTFCLGVLCYVDLQNIIDWKNRGNWMTHSLIYASTRHMEPTCFAKWSQRHCWLGFVEAAEDTRHC